MLEEIIICISMSGIAALFWSIPATRRMTGAWLTALKTVPLGCFTTVTIPILILEILVFINNTWELFPARYLRHGFLGIGLSFVGLICGGSLIVFLARLTWRTYHAKGKRSWLPFLFIFVILGGSVFVLSFMVKLNRYSDNPVEYHGEWTSFVLPQVGDVNLAFEQRFIHPFLAEYDYRLSFSKDGKTEYYDLKINTGGRTLFNIYRLQDGRLCFVDKDSCYIVDAARREVLYVFKYQRKLYAVPYPREKFDSWAWSMESGKMMFDYGTRQIEAVPLTDELKDKSYYGCISNDFYSAGEKPEQQINRFLFP